MAGLYLGSSLIGRTFPAADTLGEWGDRSFRATLVGVPTLLILQRGLGGSRPNDINGTSDWSFWNDDNGASGHAFIGAIPFLSAAQMTDNQFLKASLICASTAVAWSRVNDNDHFLSQSIIGWMIAFTAVNAVEKTNDLSLIHI